MGVVKDFRFPVSVELEGGQITRVTAEGKPELVVATPPEFRGGVEGVWTPEDLLVASVAGCYAVTLAAIAERRRTPLRSLTVESTGHVSERQDRRLGFVVVELAVRVVTDEGHEDAAEKAARRAKDACLVSLALDVPVHVTIAVETAAAVLVG